MPTVTPLTLAGDVHVAVVPLDVSTYPLAPMPRRVELFVPLPMIKSPVVVTGANALNAADAVVCPVPPLVMASVPAKVTAPVVVVLGVNPVVPAENDVTPPVEAAHVAVVPLDVST